MAIHWDISDIGLGLLMNWWLAQLNAGTNLYMHLFQNDVTPQPGITDADFVEADFPGYGAASISDPTWTQGPIVGHVATATYGSFLSFIAASSGFTSQTIYGYWINDEDGDYVWSESFGTPQLITPGAELKVQPELKNATFPNPITP